MTPEYKKIYSIANGLANLVRSEKGDVFVSLIGIIKVIKNDHFAELLLSKTNSVSEKIKVFVATYFILNRQNQLPALEGILMNLYIATIDLYEDTFYIQEDCDECGGSGEEQCYKCQGDGNVDCRTCDGDESIECDSCGGDGTEGCRYCDGKGSETEEDDEGEEIEVECAHCEGEGTEDCRDCGGNGSFVCPSCDGSGQEECGRCEGYGSDSCGECDDGIVQTDKLKYNIRRSYVAMLGDDFKKYDGEFIEVDTFNEIEENLPLAFEITYKYFPDEDVEVDDRRESSNEMEDNFVEIVDFEKLENFTNNIGF
jgi:hypothetical protein